MLDRITELLVNCTGKNSHFPATTLYNENWMLWLLLDWCSRHPENNCVHFLPKSNWYSEGRLTSAFLRNPEGRKIAEGYTHADGVVGHFSTDHSKRAAIVLDSDAKQFVVVEGKMFSKLSSGTTNAPGYDQAARNVACMAELLRCAEISPFDLASLEFVLVAPQGQIESGQFEDLVTHDSIKTKVLARVQAFQGDRDDWFEKAFLPTLERIEIRSISWENCLEIVSTVDPVSHADLFDFYSTCLSMRPNEM